MKSEKTNFWSINENDLLPKTYYSINDIAKAMRDEDRMTTWHFLRVKKIIHSNGFANKEWLKDRLCFSKKKESGNYDTFFTQKGYELIMEMWKNKSQKWA